MSQNSSFKNKSKNKNLEAQVGGIGLMLLMFLKVSTFRLYIWFILKYL